MTERGQFLDAIGGEVGCRKLSSAFYARVSTDLELKPLFPGKSLRCATEEFSAFLIQFLGGDEKMTQARWWLSLRESHARFRISESQRRAWLKHMEATLRSSELDAATRDALITFFSSSSAYVVGKVGEPISQPELASRWSRSQALDALVADLLKGRDDKVLHGLSEFSSRPSLFVGILSRMLQTGRTRLTEAVSEAVIRYPSLGSYQHAGRTLLHFAAGAGNIKVAEVLLNLGVEADVLDQGKHTPLYRMANECGIDTGPEIARALVAAGADVNYNGGVMRTTPLHMAARRGYVAIARTLLDLGADINARDRRGCTPLDRAIKCRKPQLAELLRNEMRK